MTKQDVIAAEGRAIAARPSLCLLAVLVAACACGVFAPIAGAAKTGQLLLTGSTPPSSASSPAESTEPFIRGDEESIIKSVVGPRALGLMGTALMGEPTNTVSIYTDSKCEGTPVATGTLGDLKTTGIQVKVEEDSVTTFYADQTETEEPFETSPCSTPGFNYYQGEPPEQPGEEEPPTGGGGGGEPPPGH